MTEKSVFMGYTRSDIVNLVIALVVALVIIPMTVKSDYWYASILIPWLCLALAAVGQQIVMGYTGQLALGAAGFMAAGAFACFNLILCVPYMPFPVALGLSGLIAAALGVLFGLPSLRVRGIYLMVATLASQFFIVWMIDKFGWFKNYDTSGIITAQDITIFGKSYTSPIEMYFVVVVTVAVLTILAVNMTRGSTGRSWMAVRDMDIAAESMGISLLRTKLQAFALSAFFCGVAGALFAFTYLKSLEPVAFDIKLSAMRWSSTRHCCRRRARRAALRAVISLRRRSSRATRRCSSRRRDSGTMASRGSFPAPSNPASSMPVSPLARTAASIWARAFGFL